MKRVTSKDGTSIAYQRGGSGPAVILVGGGLVDPATGRAGRSENEPLATELSEHFTVYNYDRRGRADSRDTPPYALERELEDIEALIAEAGGSAHLYGVSSGGAEETIAGARNSPVWPGLEGVAHTLAYDAVCLGNGNPPTARLTTITQPTLVATGGGDDFFEQAADAIVASMPRAERLIIEGQTHVVDPKALAPVLERFFGQ